MDKVARQNVFCLDSLTFSSSLSLTIGIIGMIMNDKQTLC